MSSPSTPAPRPYRALVSSPNPYTRDILIQSLHRRGWLVVEKTPGEKLSDDLFLYCNLCWCAVRDVPWDVVTNRGIFNRENNEVSSTNDSLHLPLLVNHHFLKTGIIRKNELYINIRNFAIRNINSSIHQSNHEFHLRYPSISTSSSMCTPQCLCLNQSPTSLSNSSIMAFIPETYPLLSALPPSTLFSVVKSIIRSINQRQGNSFSINTDDDESDDDQNDGSDNDCVTLNSSNESPSMWILKASFSSNAQDIYVFDESTEGLKRCYHALLSSSSSPKNWILQKYLHPPFLIHNKKFHLRSYLLCVASERINKGILKHENDAQESPFRLFLHMDAIICLLASGNYDDATRNNNYSDNSVHITNHSHQSTRPNFNPYESCMSLEHFQQYVSTLQTSARGGGATPSSTTSSFAKCQHPLRSQIILQMTYIIKNIFLSVKNKPKMFFSFQNCFEVFGLDFMLTIDTNNFYNNNSLTHSGSSDNVKTRLWLLEVNPSPDLSVFDLPYHHIAVKLVDDIFRICIDGVFPVTEIPLPVLKACPDLLFNETGFVEILEY